MIARLLALWRALVAVMNGSSALATGILGLVLFFQIGIVYVGWSANINGYQGWNMVGVFVFLLLPLVVAIPWVGGALYLTGMVRGFAWLSLAESAIFFVLATLNMVAYPQGFWVGLGAVGVLSMVSVIWGSPVSWFRRFVLFYAVAVLAINVYWVFTGAPTYTKAEMALTRHDRDAAEADSAKWGAVLKALPKAAYEDLSPEDRRLYDEATRRIKAASTPSRLAATVRGTVIGAVNLISPDPIEMSVRMTHYLDEREVCDARLRERNSWRVVMPISQYTRQVRGKMDITDTGDQTGRYVPLLDGIPTGKTVQGTPCHRLTWNVADEDRPYVLDGTVKLNPVTLTVRFEPH